MNGINKTQIKFIQSLRHKKYRELERSFLVEGAKGVAELCVAGLETILIACTPDYFERQHDLLLRAGAEVVSASEDQLVRMGSLQSNDTVVAVARQPPVHWPDDKLHREGLILALDDIRDPGNLGAIIRAADWFGVRYALASEQTVDCYNPKAIHASMGSFIRVRVLYTSLAEYLATYPGSIYGTFVSGNEPSYDIRFDAPGVIIVGGESHGISEEVSRLVSRRIQIPRFGAAESLNAATAAAIALYEARREA